MYRADARRQIAAAVAVVFTFDVIPTSTSLPFFFPLFLFFSVHSPCRRGFWIGAKRQPKCRRIERRPSLELSPFQSEDKYLTDEPFNVKVVWNFKIDLFFFLPFRKFPCKTVKIWRRWSFDGYCTLQGFYFIFLLLGLHHFFPWIYKSWTYSQCSSTCITCVLASENQ